MSINLLFCFIGEMDKSNLRFVNVLFEESVTFTRETFVSLHEKSLARELNVFLIGAIIQFTNMKVGTLVTDSRS